MDHHQRSVNKFTSEDEFYSSIGRFIFEFSQLEYTLRVHVAERAEIKDELFDMIVNQDFSTLCNIAEQLLLNPPDLALRIVEPSPLDQGRPPLVIQQRIARMDKERKQRSSLIKETMNTCRDIGTRRNQIVHGLWYIAEKSGVLHHTSRQKLASTSLYNDDPTSVAKTADCANALRHKIERLFYT